MTRSRYTQKENKNLVVEKAPAQTSPSPFFENGYCKGKLTRHGHMVFNPNDLLGLTLDRYGEWAHSEIDILQQLIKPGFVILDIGANIGTHTLSFARLTGESGFVYAFEPQRLVFEFLCANIVLNNHLNVFPMMVGVGEELGEIIVPIVNPYTRSNAGAMKIEGHTSGDVVRLITIDSLKLTRCNLIKVDVEGMEQKVLLGARQTINQHRPFLFIENNTPENSSKLIEFLFEMKYSCWWFFTQYLNREDVQGQPFEADEGFRPDHNLLCLPVEFRINISGFEPVLSADDTGDEAIARIVNRQNPA